MNVKNQKVSAAPDLNPSAIPSRAAGTLRGSAAEPQTPLGAGGSPGGAPPSNTAPSNSEGGPLVHILRAGLDSLYLSYPGELHPGLATQLDRLKRLAQSVKPSDIASAQYAIGDHIFAVSDRGRKGFPYILADNWFRVELAGAESRSSNRPFAYSQIASELLTLNGADAAEASLRAVVEQLGELAATDANVSRADLCVDFTTAYPLDTATDADWIARVRYLARHVVKRRFSGWSFGRGGNVVARLYDKTLEMESKPREYLKDAWRKAGWQPGQTVWRLEFQFRRPALLELGISDYRQLTQALGGLWAYGVRDWLRLAATDTPASLKDRPTHPLWLALAAVDWGLSLNVARILPPKDRLPADYRLFILSDFTSFMARERLLDPVAAWPVFWEAARTYHERRAHFTGIDFKGYLVERARNKARLFNTILNTPAANDDTPPDPTESPEARAYRKARDGE